jgi:hypothetical protein
MKLKARGTFVTGAAQRLNLQFAKAFIMALAMQIVNPWPAVADINLNGTWNVEITPVGSRDCIVYFATWFLSHSEEAISGSFIQPGCMGLPDNTGLMSGTINGNVVCKLQRYLA